MSQTPSYVLDAPTEQAPGPRRESGPTLSCATALMARSNGKTELDCMLTIAHIIRGSTIYLMTTIALLRCNGLRIKPVICDVPGRGHTTCSNHHCATRHSSLTLLRIVSRILVGCEARTRAARVCYDQRRRHQVAILGGFDGWVNRCRPSPSSPIVGRCGYVKWRIGIPMK